jgi:hypothetical protein
MAINLKEALEILESYEWVSLRFITADLQKGTGGQVIEIAKCRICRNHPTTNNQPQTKAAVIGIDYSNNTSKSPNHHFNFTRNVELPNKRTRKIHPVLITHINQLQVL